MGWAYLTTRSQAGRSRPPLRSPGVDGDGSSAGESDSSTAGAGVGLIGVTGASLGALVEGTAAMRGRCGAAVESLVSEVILGVAAEVRADMIVMGTHGRTGLARMTMGSIAEEIIRHADVPVVTVRTKHHAGCAASSCATCDLGRSTVERSIEAEEVG